MWRKIIVVEILLCFSSLAVQAKSAPADSLLVMFWNLENFFDFVDEGGGLSDAEFSPEGARRWTPSKFYAKCSAIAKSVFWTADRYGGMPDIIGVAEVENRGVLTRLLYSTNLSKHGYSIIHYDSNDHRGIDVALLWKKEKLKCKGAKNCRIDNMRTRDILLTEFETESGDSLAVVVVHLPSKYGGGKTAWKRELAAGRLCSVVDSVMENGTRDVVVMGDFNDGPQAGEFEVLKKSLVNAAAPLARKGEGSIRFNGKWSLIDMFWVTEELVPAAEMEVVHIPFLSVWDSKMSGYKPLRTYLGPNYVGGVSDHCPIVLKLRICFP